MAFDIYYNYGVDFFNLCNVNRDHCWAVSPAGFVTTETVNEHKPVFNTDSSYLDYLSETGDGRKKEDHSSDDDGEDQTESCKRRKTAGCVDVSGGIDAVGLKNDEIMCGEEDSEQNCTTTEETVAKARVYADSDEAIDEEKVIETCVEKTTAKLKNDDDYHGYVIVGGSGSDDTDRSETDVEKVTSVTGVTFDLGWLGDLKPVEGGRYLFKAIYNKQKKGVFMDVLNHQEFPIDCHDIIKREYAGKVRAVFLDDRNNILPPTLFVGDSVYKEKTTPAENDNALARSLDIISSSHRVLTSVMEPPPKSQRKDKNFVEMCEDSRSTAKRVIKRHQEIVQDIERSMGYARDEDFKDESE